MFLNIASKSLDAFSIAENKKTIQSKHISEYLKKSTMPQDMFVGTSICENVGVSDDKKSSILSHYKKESKLQKVVENWLQKLQQKFSFFVLQKFQIFLCNTKQ